MAKGRVGGGMPLSLTAKLNTADALKDADKFIKKLNEVNKAASISPVNSGMSKAFDVKPLTEYQAGLLKIKQEAADAARARQVQADAEKKAKQDQAAADKSASLVLQKALAEERLAREAINLQIAKNRLETQKLNAETSKKTATIKNRDFAAETASQNALANSTARATSIMSAQVIARAKLSAEAAKQAIAEGNLKTVTTSYVQAAQQQVSSTNSVTLSKRQLAQMLAEEKLRLQQSNAELRNNARENLNAKGSIEQRKAAIVRLTTEYGRLSVAEQNSAAGQRMAGIIRGLTDQVDRLKSATTGSNAALKEQEGIFSQLKTQVIGAALAYGSVTAAVGAAKAIAHTNAEISDSFTDVQRTAKLTGSEVDSLITSLKGLNTRTSLEGLLDIGFEGGRLGVKKEELLGFITTVDQLGVVLKKEISGGPGAIAESLGKIAIVFKLAENEGITLAEAMNKVASTQLELAHSGPVTVKYLQDFTLGMAGTATAAKLSLPVIEAYGAVLGGSGQIASSAALSLTRLISGLSTKREKYFAIAQLADATLTLEKFTETINTDAKSAIDLFFKGLTAGNPVATELDDRLKSVGITTGKVSNSVKILAKNQELLAEKIGIGTKSYEEGTSVAHNFELANNSLAASFEKLWNMIKNSIVGPSTARWFGDLINSLVTSTTEAESLAHAFQANQQEFNNTQAKLNPLLAKYDELKKQSILTKDEQEELRRVTVEIGDIMPSVITKFNSYGDALDINRSKIAGVTKAQKELLELQNKSAITGARENFDELSINARQYEKAASIAIGRGIDPTKFKESSKLISGQAYAAAKAIRDLGGQLTELEQQSIDYYETVKKKGVKQGLEILGDGSSELTPDAESIIDVASIKKEIKSLTEANIKLNNEGKQFELNVKRIRELRKQLKEAGGGLGNSSRSEETALSRAKSLGLDLSKNRAASLRNQKESDNAELDSVKDKYDAMRAKIDEFYANPKNKGQRVIIDGKNFSKSQAAGYVKADQGRDEDLVKAKQAVEATKIQVEAQKEIFNEYEQYKTKAGKEEADRRFAADLKGYKSYIDYLKGLLPSEADQSVAANKLRDLINKDLMPAAENNKKKRQEDEYTSLLMSTASYEQAAAALTEKYQTERAELIRKGRIFNVKERDRAYKEEMDGLIDHENAKSEVAKRLAEETLILTRSQIREKILGLENAMKDIKIPDGIKEKIQETIGNLKIRLSLDADQVNLDLLKSRRVDVLSAIENESKKSVPNVAALNQELSELNSEIIELDKNGDGKVSGLKKFLGSLSDSKTLKGVVEGLGLASEAAMTLSQGLGGVDTEAGYTLDTIGQLAGAAADLGGAIISGDPAKIIGSAIKAVGSLFSISKRVREMNLAAKKEVEDFYINAIKGEREYQDLLKERQLETIRTNKIALQGVREEINLRKKQAAEYSKEATEIMGKLQGQEYITSETYKHGTWFRKAKVDKTYASLAGKSFQELSQLLAQGKLENETKALVERLKELEQKGYDAEKAMADLARETSELFTGTTSSSLTDSLADMFKSGKTSAQDLADFFKTSMDDAALSIFKNKVLAGAMEGFYKEFDKAAQSGDELTSEEIARLNGLFTSLTGDALKKFEEFQRITGSNLRGSNSDNSALKPNTLTAALNQPTAERLEGLWRGQFDLTKKIDLNTYSSANSLGMIYQQTVAQFNETVKISANTLRTANNTDSLAGKLDQIITNTKPSKSARD